MVTPLTHHEIVDIFGALRGLLFDNVSATRARTVAAEAGFDPGFIPDGLDEKGLASRGPIFSGIDGQWASLDETRRAEILPRLARSLTRRFESRGEGDLVNRRLVDVGFRFENGSFVPVNALGEIPE
jgi:hypothetical protein